MARIGVILGSTRTGRISETIGKWATQQLQAAGDQHNYEIIDLRDHALPFFDEPQSPKGATEYTQPHTKAWAAHIEQFDGFLIVLPEYNGALPAVLKNALDFLYKEWAGKPVTYVSYGWGAGARSAAEFETLAPNYGFTLLPTNAQLQLTAEGFAEDGSLNDPAELFADQAAALQAIHQAFDEVLSA